VKPLRAVILMVLGGCAAPPQPVVAPEQERLADAGARGAALARAGDNAAAALGFQEALRIARTIEDADAIAVHAINLSIVYQRLGHYAAARSALGVVLDDERRRFPETRLVQARLRQAILDLAQGDATAAARHAGTAREQCERIGCEHAAAILNVQAAAALQGGDAQRSLTLALAAESAARRRAERAETANALRNAGRARAALGDAPLAIAALEQALEIDRALADPRKILADLEALAHVSSIRGDAEAARHYAERARAIRQAAGESATGVGESAVRLRR
jgi:tetratricopeptide (TPR) repeat protein